MIRPTHARVNLQAIRHNVRAVLDLIAPRTRLLVMVKANAYGHGAIPVAQAALTEGAERLGVALIEEGIALREAGIRAPIQVFTSMMPDVADVVVEHDLTPVLSTVEFAKALNEAALKTGKTRNVHVKIDTGMGRYGFRAEDKNTLSSILGIASMRGLHLEGVVTHFVSSDSSGQDEFTRSQLAIFLKMVDDLASAGVRPELIHAANTAGILRHPSSRLNMVRLGLGLYGYYPSADVPREVELEPCLELVSRIIHLKTCSTGSTVGYGRTFTAERPTRVATIPIGYADGYPRELSNLGKVIVLTGGGKTRTVCPVVGRVCMDDTLVDVTDAPGAAVGDEVILYSARREDPNSVEATAQLLGTIPYTIPTRLAARVPRVHVNR